MKIVCGVMLMLTLVVPAYAQEIPMTETYEDDTVGQKPSTYSGFMLPDAVAVASGTDGVNTPDGSANYGRYKGSATMGLPWAYHQSDLGVDSSLPTENVLEADVYFDMSQPDAADPTATVGRGIGTNDRGGDTWQAFVYGKITGGAAPYTLQFGVQTVYPPGSDCTQGGGGVKNICFPGATSGWYHVQLLQTVIAGNTVSVGSVTPPGGTAMVIGAQLSAPGTTGSYGAYVWENLGGYVRVDNFRHRMLNTPPDCSGATLASKKADRYCRAVISGDDVSGITDDKPGVTIEVNPTVVEDGTPVTITATDSDGVTCSKQVAAVVTDCIVNVIEVR